MNNILKNNFYAVVRRDVLEDRCFADVTSQAVFRKPQAVKAVIRAKEKGVICGLFVIPAVFKTLKRRVDVKYFCKEGSRVRSNAKIAELKGDIRVILGAERVLLNFLGHMSGIASLTGKFADAVKGTNARIYDTRKTTPGLRLLEKYAVETGGGFNHRFNLREMALVKDNHLSYAGGDALAKAFRIWRKKNLLIEVEVDRLSQLKKILKLGPDMVLLDNFTPARIKNAVKYVGSFAGGKKKPLVEVSGNMNLRKAKKAARLGADRISVGALTHSSKNLDFSMEM